MRVRAGSLEAAGSRPRSQPVQRPQREGQDRCVALGAQVRQGESCVSGSLFQSWGTFNMFLSPGMGRGQMAPEKDS